MLKDHFLHAGAAALSANPNTWAISTVAGPAAAHPRNMSQSSVSTFVDHKIICSSLSTVPTDKGRSTLVTNPSLRLA
jgi:hypothetical protein